MGHSNGLKTAMLLGISLGLAACGGGGGGASNNNTPGNRAPTVSAGADQTVKELTNVTLAGTASDADRDSLTYSWGQTAGPTVTINNSTSLTANFDAPDVLAANSPEIFTFRLTVSDGTTSRSDSVDIAVTDNVPPVADAGADLNVVRLSTVTLDGSASSDADGDALSFAWVQTDGPAVALAGADTAQPSFTAPDVAPGAIERLTFELTVDDGTDAATDSVTVNVSEFQSLVTVAGRLTYEFPRPDAACRLNFASPDLLPVRLATVLLLDAAGNRLAASTTDIDGNYSFSGITANTDVRVRVRAELVQTSGPQTWEVYVRDNVWDTATMGPAPSLPDRPIYEVQWSLFNSGGVDSLNNDFTARTGWNVDTGEYDGLRAAAPLSILDALLRGVRLVTQTDADVDLGRLDAFWSVDNTYSQTERWNDPDNGQLVTAYYNSDGSLFLRGDAVGRFPESRINTDEFDEQVILHEWGHYFEDQLSRSDSVGGYHQLPGVVEPRVAFGEGWGYGIGAIAANDPVGCDTVQPGSAGSRLDLENYNSRLTEQGFFNEMSIATLFWDLFDDGIDGIDGTDNDSIGFGPIYETMTGFQKDTEALTTIFSFATGLRQNVDPVDLVFIDSQLTREEIDLPGGSIDIWGSGQTTAPPQWANGTIVRDLLPLYTELVPGGATENLCVNVDTRVNDAHNSPGLWRYLRFTTDGLQDLTLTIQANPVPTATPGPDVRDRSDPDVRLYDKGTWRAYWIDQANGIISGLTPEDDREVFDMGPLNLSAGTYALSFHDWRYDDEARASDYPDQVCFDFTLTAN
jgi:hypothetical protein